MSRDPLSEQEVTELLEGAIDRRNPRRWLVYWHDRSTGKLRQTTCHSEPAAQAVAASVLKANEAARDEVHIEQREPYRIWR